MRLFLIGLLILAPSAFAQDIETAVNITEKECRKLIRINSTNGAQYVPGVDMRGNDVVAADVNDANKLELPEEITFNLGLDVAEKYNFGPGFYGKADLGEVKVKGRNVYWNGKKLDQTDNQAALDACLEQYGQK